MWEAIGLRCFDADECEVWRLDGKNQAFSCPRFVPLGWRPEQGRINVLETIDVGQVAYVIGGLDVTKDCKLRCLEALHALELIGSEERQVELFERTSRFSGCRSLLWRLALVAKPHQWYTYVTNLLWGGTDINATKKQIVRREALKLLEPMFKLPGTVAMKRLFKVRARQVARECTELLNNVLREANRRGAVMVSSMLAEIRFESDEVTAEGISRASANILDDQHMLRRMKADENLAGTWSKWYYGLGTHNHAVALQTIKTHLMPGVLGSDVVVGALMLLTDSYRIPRTMDGVLDAAHCINRLFAGWTDIHCGPELKRMLGIADHRLVDRFFRALQFSVPRDYVHECLTEPAFFAFAACNEATTVTPHLPAHIVLMVRSFL